MRILIAGGAGYIGSFLIPVLQEHGYDIDVVDLLWFGNFLPDSIKVAKRDLFKCKEKDLEIYDQIIFLAGLSNDPMAEFEPSKNFIYNAALPSYLPSLQRTRASNASYMPHPARFTDTLLMNFTMKTAL